MKLNFANSQTLDIYFLRHGQSIFQCQRLISGENEQGLSGLGKIQIHKVARNLKHIAFDCVISSDLRRSIETWNIIKPYLQIQPDANNILFTNILREKNQGVVKLQPLHILKNKDVNRDHRFEDGESWLDVQIRVQKMLHMLMSNYFLEYKVFQQDLEDQNYLDLRQQLPPSRTLQTNHKVLLLTHYGFIREFFYSLRQKQNQNFDENDSNQGYYAQNATVFQVSIAPKTTQDWSTEIVAMNSRDQQHRPFSGIEF